MDGVSRTSRSRRGGGKRQQCRGRKLLRLLQAFIVLGSPRCACGFVGANAGMAYAKIKTQEGLLQDVQRLEGRLKEVEDLLKPSNVTDSSSWGGGRNVSISRDVDAADERGDSSSISDVVRMKQCLVRMEALMRETEAVLARKTQDGKGEGGAVVGAAVTSVPQAEAATESGGLQVIDGEEGGEDEEAQQASEATLLAGLTGEEQQQEQEEEEEQEQEQQIRTDRQGRDWQSFLPEAEEILLGRLEEQVDRVKEAVVEDIDALSEEDREAFDSLKAFFEGREGEEGGEGLSREESEALIPSAICGDVNLLILSFARPVKFNLQKARDAMRRAAAWRVSYGANDMFSHRVSKAKMLKHRELWPTGFHGRDKKDNPLFFDRLGLANIGEMRKEPNALEMEDIVRLYCQNMEIRRRFVLSKMSREQGRPVTQMVSVLDLTGLGMRHLAKDSITYTRAINEIFKDNYADMVKGLKIVNAPWIFSKAWGMVEPILGEETLAKISVLGSGEKGLKKLEETVEHDHIPSFMGGPEEFGANAAVTWKEIDSAMERLGKGECPFSPTAEEKERLAKKRLALSAQSASDASEPPPLPELLTPEDALSMMGTPAAAAATASRGAEEEAEEEGPIAIGEPSKKKKKKRKKKRSEGHHRRRKERGTGSSSSRKRQSRAAAKDEEVEASSDAGSKRVDRFRKAQRRLVESRGPSRRAKALVLCVAEAVLLLARMIMAFLHLAAAVLFKK